MMCYGRIPIETQSNHDINESTNFFKLSVAWLIGKVLIENEEKFNFFFFCFHSTSF